MKTSFLLLLALLGLSNCQQPDAPRPLVLKHKASVNVKPSNLTDSTLLQMPPQGIAMDSLPQRPKE